MAHRSLALWAAIPACAALLAAPAAARDDAAAWVRVEYGQRLAEADVDALAATGARGLAYAPVNAQLAFATAEQQRAAADLPGVRAVRRLGVADKLDESLRHTRGHRAVTVIVAADARAELDAVAALGVTRGRWTFDVAGYLPAIDVDLDAQQAAAIAARPGVLYVGPAATGAHPEDEGATQILANNFSGSTPVPGYEDFLAGLGLDGSGVTVSIADDGMDPTHPEFLGRIARRISYGPVGAYPAEGHGTHVAGIVGGQGAQLPGIGRVRDGAGLLYGIGVAPKVTFVDQNVIELVNSVVNPPRNGANLEAWVRDGVRAGSIGWNASWHSGQGTGAGYIANAALLDRLTRDGDAQTVGAQEFTMVFSAGNAGSGPSTITSPKEAKNIITVGNSLGHRAGNINSISSSSSRGPTRDGRVAPTVAAPGSSIVSARAAMGALCTTSPPTDSYGLYSACSGTSMAAPQVTGSVALIHQWWARARDGARPSTEMAKALLVNSATDMGAKDIPNGAEGWGRVNLATLFDPAAVRVLEDRTRTLDDLDEEAEWALDVADPSRQVKVTLAWTDVAGAPGANPALVNDLDLVVTTSDGSVYTGNAFAGGRSVAGGAPDRRNNVENVFLPVGLSGPVLVTVRAANLPGDGVPGGDTTDQDFALVVTNAG